MSAGCSWFSNELTLGARLPEPPTHWLQAFPDLRYELLVPQPDGTIDRGPWPESGTITIPKDPNWPVLAVPHIRDGRVHLPLAGAFWPLDLTADGQTLDLSWEHGPLAVCLVRLRRERVDVSAFNTTRLAREMLARAQGDPWRLDLPHLLSCLAEGSLRVTDIRFLPCRDMFLTTGPGKWFLESPFFTPLVSSTGGSLILPDVPRGFHRLFAMGVLAWDDLLVTDQEALIIPGN